MESPVKLDLEEILPQYVHSGDGIYLAPNIPPRKLANARRAHARHLPEGERVLLLYDDTLFGGGREGVLLTPQRICWKNFLEHPRSLAFEDLAPEEIGLRDGTLHLAEHELEMATAEELASALYELLQLVTAVAHRDEGEAMSLEAIVRRARAHLGLAVDRVHFHPSIPPRKLQGATSVHGARLLPAESVAVLYDDTLLGSSADGWIITPLRLAWHNPSEEAHQLEWTQVEPGRVEEGAGKVLVHGQEIVMVSSELVPGVVQLIQELAALSRSAALPGR